LILSKNWVRFGHNFIFRLNPFWSALINTEIVASCNAIKTLVEAIMDPKCEEMAGPLTLTLLFLLDQDSTRRHLRPSLELQKLLCVFTDTDAPDSPERETKKKTATEALVMMMRSWTGILILSSDEYGLKSIIRLMSLPDKVKGAVWARNAVTDLLFEILEVVKVPGFSGFGLRGGIRANLLNNYIVMVLMAFVNCGLVDVLTDIGINGSREAAGVATSLLSAVLNLAADLLPPAQNARLNALPSVVNLASRFDGEINQRIRASNILGDLSEYSDHLTVSSTDPAGIPIQHQKTRAKSASVAQNDAPSQARGPLSLEAITSQTDINSNYRRYRRFTKERRKQYMVKSLRVQVESKMDENEINNALRESQVIAHKEYRKWDFSMCLELLEGPLLNAQLLSYVMNKTKFIKRLLSFLKPSKKFFSTLPWNVENAKFTAVACQLFRVLTSTEEATQYTFFVELVDEIFMTLICKATNKPLNPEYQFDLLHLTQDALATTLSCEYFTLIGILSETKLGLKFLEKWNFFNDLYALATDPVMDYLSRAICTNLDYGGHTFEESSARQLISFYLYNGSKANKIYFLEHIRLMLRANVEGFQDWGLDLLVTVVDATDMDVALAALAILEEVCEQSETLEALIRKNPSFKVVGKHADNLLTKFLSHPAGVDYLDGLNWIEPQFEFWRSEGMLQYVEELENALVAALNDNVSSPRFGGLSSRTLEEEYFYDRLHNLPWRMDVTIYRSESEYKVSTDAYVESRTSPDGGLQLYVVAEMRNDKTARFNWVDANTTIQATLQIGKEESLTSILKERWTKKCLPKTRQAMTKDNRSVSEDGVIWEFDYDVKKDDDDDDDEPQGEKVKVKTIAFNLPFSSSSYTVVSLAPHFYGELCKTKEGVELFQRKGHFAHFIDMVRNPETSWIERRAALWTIGHIGSSETGFQLLKETDIVQYISNQAMSCTTLSMRGTCFYILGLLSLPSAGREVLDKLGWDFPLNTDLAIAVPKDIVSFLKVPTTNYAGSWALSPQNKFGVNAVPSTTGKTSTKLAPENYASVVLGHISNLGNNVTQKQSHATLTRMRQRYPQYFQSAALMFEAAKLMASYSFHLPPRRFVWFDLFDQVDLSEVGILAFDGPADHTVEKLPAPKTPAPAS
jgi:hypothetical protein